MVASTLRLLQCWRLAHTHGAGVYLCWNRGHSRLHCVLLPKEPICSGVARPACCLTSTETQFSPTSTPTSDERTVLPDFDTPEI